MIEIEIGKAKSIIIPAGVNAVEIVHEWGDQVVSATGLIAGNNFSLTPDSIGIYKFIWLNGSTTIRTDFYSAYVAVVTSTEFFEDNDTLDGFEDEFAKLERSLRHTIQNYTGQRFGPYVNKSMEIQGDGGDSLYLPVRIVSLTSIANNFGDDLTDFVEICPNDPTLLQKDVKFRVPVPFMDIKRDIMWRISELFSDNFVFNIVGNWGWEYVPSEITEAAKLLLIDAIGDADIAALNNKGVFQAQIGDFMLKMGADSWGTTGNSAADNLLAAHVIFGIGLA